MRKRKMGYHPLTDDPITGVEAKRLTVRIISGQNLFPDNPKNVFSIHVETFGCAKDCQVQKARECAGTSPLVEQTLVFEKVETASLLRRCPFFLRPRLFVRRWAVRSWALEVVSCSDRVSSLHPACSCVSRSLSLSGSPSQATRGEHSRCQHALRTPHTSRPRPVPTALTGQ